MTMSFSEVADYIRSSCAPTGMTTKIIAIDGCGAAGKTTLSEKLSKLFGNCSVIHTDDFASWDDPLNWYPRMIKQALEPLKLNKEARFQKYDWKLRSLDHWITVQPAEFVIIEGVSSSRTEFRTYLAYSIFVHADRSLRLSRGIERDGKNTESHWLDWMHAEDVYIRRDEPEKFVDLVVSGQKQHESDGLICLGGRSLNRSMDVR